MNNEHQLLMTFAALRASFVHVDHLRRDAGMKGADFDEALQALVASRLLGPPDAPRQPWLVLTPWGLDELVRRVLQLV